MMCFSFKGEKSVSTNNISLNIVTEVQVQNISARRSNYSDIKKKIKKKKLFETISFLPS